VPQPALGIGQSSEIMIRFGFRKISASFYGFFTCVTIMVLAECQPRVVTEIAPAARLVSSATVTMTKTTIPSSTPYATASPTPSSTLFPLPTQDPQSTSIACDLRRPTADDLLAEVNASYGLDPNYIPGDLVPLGDYLPGHVTLPDMLLRQVAAVPLGKMVKVMLADGLAPSVLSSYRSYFEQAVAHQRWVVEDPVHADQISALPGHSEHQLGTVVDFGSPEMPAITGSNTDKFSPLFATTGVGRWLAEHAFEYGFTMTSPPGAEALTGLAYEPWHYRYIGVDLALYLRTSGYFLDEYLLKVRPLMPCLP
jgi:zinc D-Ala-D-Ala carboxypeptidase